MTTLYVRKSIGRSPLRRVLLLIPLALICFAVSPTAQAVCQEGCLTNDNTVLGDDALMNNTGLDNTAIGFKALFSNTTGNDNTAIGEDALYWNTTGSNNTANGLGALVLNTTGFNNTADGFGALGLNTTGSANTATGFEALLSNTTGTANTASGFDALLRNTTGFNNTATGSYALNSNTTGGYNTATGSSALVYNTKGSENTANGFEALYWNDTGNNNTANGSQALLNNNADNNTANGYAALTANTTGSDNTASGFLALRDNTTGKKNTAIGLDALSANTTGSYNVALGFNAGFNLTTGDRNIDIGNAGVAGESSTIRIGRVRDQTATFIAGISGVTVASGVGVIIDSNGQLGTIVSSERFKEGVKPMDKTSEGIFALRPVTFRYKHELDPNGIPQFGLVAEEVEKVNPDLVARDEQGKPYTVRYEAVNAMLLNEFLKEHRKVEQQQATITQLKKGFDTTIAQLSARLDKQASQIQKVSAQLEANKPAPQVVNNQ